LNYKVVDLVERYNFHIKFTSVRVQKELKKFENRLYPTVVAHAGSRRYSTFTPLTPWGTVVGHCRRPPRR
jgi:hypothetical protein